VDSNRVTYQTDSLGRLQYEEREDWSGAAWVSKYSITQTYDKNGNRTGYNKAVSGSTADYGIAENLSYTFNAVNALTAITDAVETRYTCVVTCDANNNITQLDEVMSGAGTVPPFQNNHLYSIFEYDDLNRQTKHKTKAWVAGGTNNWVWVERQHEYSAVGALLRSGWRTYPDGTSPGAYSSSKHAYDQQTGNFVQNVATSGAPPAKGTRWVWAGADNAGYGNLFGPNSDTASQNAYTVNAAGGAGIPNRRTFINPSTEGDKRELWGQGRPMGKDSNTAWSTGTISQPANTHMNPVTSRLVFEGTVSSTDLSRITDMREKGRMGIFGTGFSYAGASGRVTSEALGRDLNPLGRGDGVAYVGGGQNVGESAQALGLIFSALPMNSAQSGNGCSSNNSCGFGVCPPSTGGYTPGSGLPLFSPPSIWSPPISAPVTILADKPKVSNREPAYMRAGCPELDALNLTPVPAPPKQIVPPIGPQQSGPGSSCKLYKQRDIRCCLKWNCVFAQNDGKVTFPKCYGTALIHLAWVMISGYDRLSCFTARDIAKSLEPDPNVQYGCLCGNDPFYEILAYTLCHDSSAPDCYGKDGQGCSSTQCLNLCKYQSKLWVGTLPGNWA
jgi:hypothetical protein